MIQSDQINIKTVCCGLRDKQTFNWYLFEQTQKFKH